MNTAAVSTDCNANGCRNSAAIVLAGQDLCFDHFFASCYEQLDKLEARLRHGVPEAGEVCAARIFLEECSNRVLYVSLRHASLTNLERSRFLEILLSCGDLQRLIRRPFSRKIPGLDLGLAAQGNSSKG